MKPKHEDDSPDEQQREASLKRERLQRLASKRNHNTRRRKTRDRTQRRSGEID